MFGTNIYLTHRLVQMQVGELLAEAKRQRAVTIAATRPQISRTGIAAVQAVLRLHP